MSTSTITHDLRSSNGAALSLPGLPWGLPAGHDPALTQRIPIEWQEGPAGVPLSQPRHDALEDQVLLEVEEIPSSAYRLFLFLQRDAEEDATFQYSPLGTASYTSSGWRLVTTSQDWVQQWSGRWNARIHLVRKGADY